MTTRKGCAMQEPVHEVQKSHCLCLESKLDQSPGALVTRQGWGIWCHRALVDGFYRLGERANDSSHAHAPDVTALPFQTSNREMVC